MQTLATVVKMNSSSSARRELSEPEPEPEPVIITGWENSTWANADTIYAQERYTYIGKDEDTKEPMWLDYGAKGGRSSNAASDTEIKADDGQDDYVYQNDDFCEDCEGDGKEDNSEKYGVNDHDDDVGHLTELAESALGEMFRDGYDSGSTGGNDDRASEEDDEEDYIDGDDYQSDDDQEGGGDDDDVDADIGNDDADGEYQDDDQDGDDGQEYGDDEDDGGDDDNDDEDDCEDDYNDDSCYDNYSSGGDDDCDYDSYGDY